MSDDETPKTDLIEKFGETGLIEATGTDCLDLQLGRIRQLLETLWLPKDFSAEDIDARVNAAIADLMAIRPRDAFEGPLAVQMVAVHYAAMGCLQQAVGTPQTPYTFERLKQAEKLMALYLRQMEVFDKHRGIGVPSVNVGNVNVQPGGQAIVGHVQVEQKPDQHEGETQSPGKTIEQKPVETLDLKPADPVYAGAKSGRRGSP